MAVTLDALTQDALLLPPDQRILLAHWLFSSVKLGQDSDTEAAWEQEIAQRIVRADAGETTPIPAAKVFARLERIAPTMHDSGCSIHPPTDETGKLSL